MTTQPYPDHAAPTHAAPRSKTRPAVDAVLVLAFASPLTLALGFGTAALAARISDGGFALLALFAGPAVLAALVSRAVGSRLAPWVLPLVAMISIAGWGLLALSRANLG